MTADRLLCDSGLGRCELICGQVMTLPFSTYERALIATDIALLLDTFIQHRGLGIVTIGGGGYWIERDPDTVLAPDAGFIRESRAPRGTHLGYI